MDSPMPSPVPALPLPLKTAESLDRLASNLGSKLSLQQSSQWTLNVKPQLPSNRAGKPLTSARSRLPLSRAYTTGNLSSRSPSESFLARPRTQASPGFTPTTTSPARESSSSSASSSASSVDSSPLRFNSKQNLRCSPIRSPLNKVNSCSSFANLSHVSFEDSVNVGSSQVPRPAKFRRTNSEKIENRSSLQCDIKLYCMVSEPVESTSEKFLLPCFDTKKDAFPRISGQTIVELLNGRFTELIDDFYIIDCRFSYEYAYGHILHARNITTSGDLETLFFEPLPAATRNRTVLIFHCEYSSQRAPTMAQHLRSHDRSVNTYPNLCYPHVYVLEGGYRNFWSEYRSMCNPDGYREMDERGWSKECALGMKGYRREFKKAKSFAGPELRREAW